MSDKYKDALHAAQEELTNLESRRAALLRLIQTLKELSDDDKYELSPPPGYVPKGLTEEIRTILALTTSSMDAMEIRDALIQRGFPYRSPKHLLINVHTVIGRIEDELEVTERGEKKAYKVKDSTYSAVEALLGGGDYTIGVKQSASGLLIPQTFPTRKERAAEETRKQREKEKK